MASRLPVVPLPADADAGRFGRWTARALRTGALVLVVIGLGLAWLVARIFTATASDSSTIGNIVYAASVALLALTFLGIGIRTLLDTRARQRERPRR